MVNEGLRFKYYELAQGILKEPECGVVVYTCNLSSQEADKEDHKIKAFQEYKARTCLKKQLKKNSLKIVTWWVEESSGCEERKLSRVLTWSWEGKALPSELGRRQKSRVEK
jgi:hypothetical protein